MHRVKDVQLGLSAAEVQEVLSIVLDQDRDKALAFVQDVLGKKVEKRLQEHWVPVFEVSYGPGQANKFS